MTEMAYLHYSHRQFLGMEVRDGQIYFKFARTAEALEDLADFSNPHCTARARDLLRSAWWAKRQVISTLKGGGR